MFSPTTDTEGRPALEIIEGGRFFAATGLRAAAVPCGLKADALDLALLVADQPRTTVGVFTRNALPAAPVIQCRETLAEHASARAIVINAGNANAMTGPRGLEDARSTAERVRVACGGPVLVLSTGVIGVPLPVQRVLSGVDVASQRLRTDSELDVADAIRTTDLVRKQAAVRVTLSDVGGEGARTATVGGIAKGSGMIHPNMATMLAIVATDVPVRASVLQPMLHRAVDRSFHEITVDGDTSTNDTVLLMAGHPSAGSPIDAHDARAAELEHAVTEVMRDLAGQILRDGEGATRVLELHVTGARTEGDARRIADSIVRSSLVKTALAGADPNWGRILAAAANAGVPLEQPSVSLALGGVTV
jgi:glutamate N-acetyltransferase/amino-acid N-acetyltransferase